MPTFTAFTRAAGLARFEAFQRSSGRVYADRRNTDLGPGEEPTTSALSPYLRRRLVLEEEVAAGAIAEHGPGAAEKFVQEVFWRAYFKGHLESRPAIWDDYLRQVAEGQARLAASAGVQRAYREAVEGRTGIDGFDHWARELAEYGWLHNHARMWFASIWIFTLRLPWALGADLFLRTLLDGDPASNTLSWRWVAGLHTRGKAYAARAENIARYTQGRFMPTGLNEEPQPLTEALDHPLVPLPACEELPSWEWRSSCISMTCTPRASISAAHGWWRSAASWCTRMARPTRCAPPIARRWRTPLFGQRPTSGARPAS